MRKMPQIVPILGIILFLFGVILSHGYDMMACYLQQDFMGKFQFNPVTLVDLCARNYNNYYSCNIKFYFFFLSFFVIMICTIGYIILAVKYLKDGRISKYPIFFKIGTMVGGILCRTVCVILPLYVLFIGYNIIACYISPDFLVTLTKFCLVNKAGAQNITLYNSTYPDMECLETMVPWLCETCSSNNLDVGPSNLTFLSFASKADSPNPGYWSTNVWFILRLLPLGVIIYGTISLLRVFMQTIVIPRNMSEDALLKML